MTRKALSTAELADALLPVAREAGRVIMSYYQKGTPTERKQDNSPVTEADRRADAFITAALKQLAPQIAIVSEEGHQPDIAGEEYFWLVDPLDGTRSFVRGSGYFTVNIGLIGPSRLPVMGIIYEPVEQVMYWGYGMRAWRQKQGAEPVPIQVRRRKKERVAMVSHAHSSRKMDEFLAQQDITQRQNCASSIKFCRLAEGEVDLYPRFGPTMEWDTAAGHAILLAAGGRMVTPEGTLFRYGKPRFENGDFLAESME